MPIPSKTRSLGGICLVAGALALSACASNVPAPTEQVTLSDNIIRNAEEAGAVQHSPVELNMARDKLEGARREMQDENHEKALRLAEEAEVDARLAELKSRTATTKEAVAAVQSSIDTLRRELNAGPMNRPTS
jgi:septal ring factor EnvC (AmiA/AmiB activator)